MMLNTGDNNFLKLFHNRLVGMIITNEQHIIVDVNDQLLHITEMEREDVMGKTGLELGILDEAFVKGSWQQLLENERIFNRELLFTSKNGKPVSCIFSTEKTELNGNIFWLSTLIDISKRKRSERELANVYERVTDAFVAIDTNWNYVYVNKKAGELLEKDPDYLVGQHIWTVFPEDIGQPVYKAYHEAMERQVMISMEEYYQPYDRWFQNLIYPSADGLSVFFSDITARKKAEQRIAESELRFRTLTKTAPVGIFETDANGSTTYVNETWLEYTGMQLEEALGDGWLNAVHPEDRDKLKKGWDSSTEKASLSISEYRLVCKSGRIRWVDGKAIPVINQEGKLTGYIGTISDVTELKQAVELFKQSEETLNKAQQISKTGNWEFNLLTGELFWSKELYRMYELESHPAETLYEAYRNKYHPDDLHKLDEVIKNAIEKGEGYTYEHRIICNGGQIKYILGIGEVVCDADGKVIALKGTGQDITERKPIEEALNERTEQLRDLSTHLQNIREAERTMIAREIHDELGQQLTGLKMDITWLKKKIKQDDPLVKDKFKDAIELIDAMVKSIRRIATELRPSIIDDLGLNAALEWQVNDFSERMGTKVGYKNDFDDSGIHPDISIGLFRILQESLTNIAKHARARKVSVQIVRTGDKVQLQIEDDGIGFDPDLKKPGISFGILGIRERTYMMKGECLVHSRPGQGTKINVRIPID